MNWENFEESDLELPEKTIEKMIQGFSAATQELAKLGIEEKFRLSSFIDEKLKTKFQFQVLLVSNSLPDYSYTVFEFGYNVSLYPVKVYFNKAILDELANKGDVFPQIATFEEEESLKRALYLVFNSQTFTNVVRGLIKIVKSKRQPF